MFTFRNQCIVLVTLSFFFFEPSYCNTLTAPVRSLVDIQKYSELETLLMTRLEHEEKAGVAAQQMRDTLFDLGMLYSQNAKYAEAENALLRAQSYIEEKSAGLLSGKAEIIRDLLVLNYTRQGKWSEAESVYLRLLNTRNELLGPQKALFRASLLKKLGLLYIQQKKFDQAEHCLKRALLSWKDCREADESGEANTLSDLAGLYQRLGKYVQAESCLKRSLVVRAERGTQAAIAIGCDCLGGLYLEMGKLNASEEQLRRALSIRESILPPDHELVASSLNELGAIYLVKHEYGKAESLLKRSLAIWEKNSNDELSPDAVSSLCNLAKLYASEGKYELAQPLFVRALRILDISDAVERPTLAILLNNYGDFFYRQGQFDQAESLYRRSLKLMPTAKSSKNLSTATSLSGIANVYRERLEFEKAKPLYLRALSIREKLKDRSDYGLAQLLMDYACFLRKTGKANRANILESRANVIFKQTEVSCIHCIQTTAN